MEVDMLQKLIIGHIVNTQGVKGDLRVIPLTDDITRFEKLETLTLERNNKEIGQYTIEKVWYHKNFVILKFKEIQNMTEAEKLKDSLIVISREQAITLPEDTYFIGDLVGLEVYSDENEHLGSIVEVIRTGSNDVFVVKKQGVKKELLIPFIKSCVLQVDLENQKVLVHLLEGLRDL